LSFAESRLGGAFVSPSGRNLASRCRRTNIEGAFVQRKDIRDTRRAAHPAGCPAPGANAALVLYTDGVTEAEHAEGEFFGSERSLACVQAHRMRPPGQICDAILADVVVFVRTPHPADDIALVVVKRAG
jgi:hypothetical protein